MKESVWMGNGHRFSIVEVDTVDPGGILNKYLLLFMKLLVVVEKKFKNSQ